MAYNFSTFTKNAKDAEDWLKKELSLLRTGRATSAMLDNIYVDAYGAQTPIPHVATVSIEDPRTIRISPWDKTQLKAIEESLRKADLGLSVGADDQGIRVSFPELTSERRTQLTKLVREKLEEARITLRKEREAVLDDAKTQKTEGTMSEDDFFKVRDDLQKLMDGVNTTFDNMATKKEEDLQS